MSPRTRAALEPPPRPPGSLVVFVTGRPPRWLDDVVEQTGHLGVAVGANGAVIYDLHDEHVVRAHTLEPGVAHVGRRRCPRTVSRRSVTRSNTSTDSPPNPTTCTTGRSIPTYDRKGNPLPAPRIAPVTEIADRPLLKVLAKDKGRDVDEFLELAGTMLGDRASITHSSSIGLLEIAAPGVTKATGLAEVAATHGIAPDEVAAIGDMPNDVPMLQWAGRSYAVANAHPSARAAADEVVGSNDEDAVAVLIESLLTVR